MDRILKLRPPTMPNYAGYAIPPGRRQDGFDLSNNQFPIEEFSREEAEEYGELMKQEFIKHWEKRQQNGKPNTGTSL